MTFLSRIHIDGDYLPNSQIHIDGPYTLQEAKEIVVIGIIDYIEEAFEEATFFWENPTQDQNMPISLNKVKEKVKDAVNNLNTFTLYDSDNKELIIECNENMMSVSFNQRDNRNHWDSLQFALSKLGKESETQQ